MIRFCNDGCTVKPQQRRKIRRWLDTVARHEGFALGQVTYIFCSAEKLLQMNRQFLGHDYYTDVITFDYGDKHAKTASGDIFIDVETVADNARIYGAAKRTEMLRVIVHGLLHLCGQKDKTPRTEAQMHRKEDKYLKLFDSMTDDSAL